MGACCKVVVAVVMPLLPSELPVRAAPLQEGRLMTAKALMSRPEIGGEGDVYKERMLPGLTPV